MLGAELPSPYGAGSAPWQAWWCWSLTSTSWFVWRLRFSRIDVRGLGW